MFETRKIRMALRMEARHQALESMPPWRCVFSRFFRFFVRVFLLQFMLGVRLANHMLFFWGFVMVFGPGITQRLHVPNNWVLGLAVLIQVWAKCMMITYLDP